VLPGMRARHAGRILNVLTSVRSPLPWMGAYFASKAAVWQLSAAMAYEVAATGVEVAVIQPGGYKTDWQTDSLWVTERSREGHSPYGTQTEESLAAFRRFSEGWQGPDDFGQRVALLAEVPSIPFWNIVAHEDHQERGQPSQLTFEEQGALLREAIPGFIPPGAPL
ncbi:MAG TPA: SDR family NAD(P)-dependent oxidoreductase, partial [Dehalococcoidia bacterium]|nr:SDR family NAD(P)-dependent oxidoreductase [Dehalococcoidia bacterium]